MLRKQFLSAALVTAFAIGTMMAEEREQLHPITPTLTWLNDMDEALAASKKSGKPILVEFR